MIEHFINHCEENNLEIELIQSSPVVFKTNSGKTVWLFIPEEGESTVNATLSLAADPSLIDQMAHQVSHVCFLFGGDFYLSPISEAYNLKLKPFRHEGQIALKSEYNFPQIAIHDHFELLNGTKKPSDYINKAKFSKVSAIGICNRQSLAGAVSFQFAAESAKIDSIIGMEIIVDGLRAPLKLYVQNQIGFENLIFLSNLCNAIRDRGPVTFEEIIENGEGLCCVIHGDNARHLSTEQLNALKQKFNEDLYIQVDTTKFNDEDVDVEKLTDIQAFLKQGKGKIAKPAYINDVYVLDSQHSPIRRKLRALGGAGLEPGSEDRHFKNADEIEQQLNELTVNFSDEKRKAFISAICKNTQSIVDKCKGFKIDKKLKLPQYVPTTGESTRELFDRLVEEGFQKRVLPKISEDQIPEYRQRLKEEIEVVADAGFIDYFMIVWDIYDYGYKNDILWGSGRGSAAGSLLGYVLYLHHVDPIKYNLMFSRFLNKGRVKSGMPDIDSDVESAGREDIRNYLRERFGFKHVCNIGTFQTLQARAAIKDLARFSSLRGEHAGEVNLLTSIMLNDPEDWNNPDDFEMLFINAIRERKLKQFIKDNGLFINQVREIYGTLKTYGVHAAGMIVAPSTDAQGREIDLFRQIPMRIADDGTYVTMWEFGYCEKVGFMKEDLLSIQHLDKMKMIKKLAEAQGKVFPNIYEIEPNDYNVLSLFSRGLVQDTFHFGSDGLSNYVAIAKPDNFEDLITMIALFRPGPMESGLHMKWIKIKNGEDVPSYDWGVEPFTKNTSGLYCYQEQIIQIISWVCDLDEAQGDDVRRAIGKKDKAVMDSFAELFVKMAEEKGCDHGEAVELWHKLVVFSGYGFNRAHAASYALNGYISQYFKYYFPLEFWTTALQFARDNEDIVKFTREMTAIRPELSLYGIDINKSNKTFSFSYESNKIFWGFERVAHVGSACADLIVKQREANGYYYSLEEFIIRTHYKNSGVNSRQVKHLIICGAFDEIENIKEPLQRIELVRQYYAFLRKTKQLEASLEKEPFPVTDWGVLLLSKQLSGFGNIDFKSTIENQYPEFRKKFMSAIQINLSTSVGCEVVCCGLLQTRIERKTKNGPMGVLTILENSEMVRVTIWPEQWAEFKGIVTKEMEEKQIVLISGVIKADSYNNCNCLYSDKKSTLRAL